MAKSLLKKLFHYCKKAAVALLLVILLYVSAAFILSRIPVNSKAKNDGEIAVFVKTNGVHTDIVVPIKNEVKDWSNDIVWEHTKAQDTTASYVAFGWGDKGFYLNTPHWKDLKASTAFIAAFHLGTSAMHTRFYNAMQENEDCIKVILNKEDYKQLVQYIADSFAYDNKGKVQWIANRGYGSYDAFYEAKRKYNLFYTCNTWANNALKAANRKAALWTLTDKGILHHYKE